MLIHWHSKLRQSRFETQDGDAWRALDVFPQRGAHRLNNELPLHSQLMSHFLCSRHYNGAWTHCFHLPRELINFTTYPREMVFKLIWNMQLPFSRYFEINPICCSKKRKTFTRTGQCSPTTVTIVNAVGTSWSADLLQKRESELLTLLSFLQLWIIPLSLPPASYIMGIGFLSHPHLKKWQSSTSTPISMRSWQVIGRTLHYC